MKPRQDPADKSHVTRDEAGERRSLEEPWSLGPTPPEPDTTAYPVAVISSYHRPTEG